MLKKSKILNKIFISFALLLTCVFGLLSGFGINNIAHAEDNVSSYTNVLEDLQKDEKFNVSSYPKDVGDLSLKVIQIAETTGKELLVYVYQPSADKQYMAKSINISVGSDLKYNVFELVYLNNNETLYKFKVSGLQVSSDPGRHYDISSISRSFVKGVDQEPDNGNTISEIAYPVGQKWIVATIEDNVLYKRLDTETIEITDKFVGFVRYNGGFKLLPNKSCDSHFVAFSTDKSIDKLLSADVYFKTQKMHYIEPIDRYKSTFYKEIENNVSLSYSDKASVSVPADIFGKITYKWDRIQSVEDFKNDVNFSNVYVRGLINTAVMSKITEEGMASLEEKQWVLRFFESNFSEYFHKVHNGLSFDYINECTRTIVSDVSILRLEFETDGVVYNLGVIDNKQTGGDKPINDFEIKNDYSKLLKIIGLVILVVIVLVALVLLSVLSPLFQAIFVVIGKGIYYFFAGVWWLISAPFSVFKDD